MAKAIREAARRGENMGFTNDELAFYDALAVSETATEVLGDDTLKAIARDLVVTVRANASIDWTMKEAVRAKLRTMVRRLLAKYGYPPDKREDAVRLVLEQAESLGKIWAA